MGIFGQKLMIFFFFWYFRIKGLGQKLVIIRGSIRRESVRKTQGFCLGMDMVDLEWKVEGLNRFWGVWIWDFFLSVMKIEED